MNKNYVIVSNRPWSRGMAERLSITLKCNFILIDSKKDLKKSYLDSINPKMIFFPHWSYKIDKEIYENFECVIFHMTDLPTGRGGSPLQNLIIQGLYETQISAIKCVEDMDGGPIYLKRPFSLYGAAEEIFIRASTEIENMVIEILERLPTPQPQKGEVTVFKRRKPEEGNLINASTLNQIFDLIRMLDADGYPKAFLELGPFKLEFSRASLKTDHLLADVKISLVDTHISEIKNDKNC